MIKKALIALVALGAALFVAAQVVPFGRSHLNPALNVQPKWDSPVTQKLAERACFSCHSNVTTWPWYSNIAPVSWLVQRDVVEGRKHLNFTEWNKPQPLVGMALGDIQSGAMPPWFYRMVHPDSRLTAKEKALLEKGLIATLIKSPAGSVKVPSQMAERH